MISVKVSVKIAFCSIVTAISVSLLLFGGTAVVFAYTMPVFTGIFMMMLKKTFGLSSAVISFVSTSLLSLLLVPDKECALMYIFFFGYYPIILDAINKIKVPLLKWLIKLAIFNVMISLCQIVLVYVFGIPFISDGEGKYFIIIFVILMNLLLIIYDLLISKMKILYEHRIEKMLKKYLR